MKKIILSLFLFALSGASGQNIDSLLTNFLSVHDNKTIDGEPAKCEFETVARIAAYYSRYSPAEQKEIAQILSRPQTDTSVVSPNGKFRVHYNLNSSSSPKYDIAEFLIALDSVYDKEITEIGFPMPPSDNGAGGDDLYDFYIIDLGSCCYGYTTPEVSLGNDKYTSFVTLDNDYGSGFYTHGIDAAKVTAAHEFNHGVQIGNYIYRTSDSYYYELTSTAMEDFVFDYVNDYIAYMGEYFRHPEYSFPKNSGYDLAIWDIFVRDVLGYSAIVDTWKEMPNHYAVQAVDFVFNQNGSSLKRGLNEFGEWVFFTGFRAKPNRYFKDAAKYPLLSIYGWSGDPLFSEQTVTLEPVSNLYRKEIVGGDTLITLITNGDVNGALTSSYRTIDANYRLYQSQSEGIEITPDLSYDLTSDLLEELSVLHFLNNDLAGATASLETTSTVYPQPFRYGDNSYLYFPLSKGASETASLKIYSLSGRLLFAKEYRVNSGTSALGWDATDLSGDKLGTGIYIYVTEKNGNILRGKFAVIN